MFQISNSQIQIFLYRIPVTQTTHFKTACFKKRLFLYIAPVVAISTLVNGFKFTESSVRWAENGTVELQINSIRTDPLYLMVNRYWEDI